MRNAHVTRELSAYIGVVGVQARKEPIAVGSRFIYS